MWLEERSKENEEGGLGRKGGCKAADTWAEGREDMAGACSCDGGECNAMRCADEETGTGSTESWP